MPLHVKCIHYGIAAPSNEVASFRRSYCRVTRSVALALIRSRKRAVYSCGHAQKEMCGVDMLDVK